MENVQFTDFSSLGHRYGSTLVPFSAEDKEAMKFRATKCLKILCFTKQENVSYSHEKYVK